MLVNVRSSSEDRLAEYAVRFSTNGSPYAVHCPTGIRLHSAVDPVTESEEIASSMDMRAHNLVLFGGGLGYLPERLVNRIPGDSQLNIIEPNPELISLSKCCRPDSEYLNSSRIRIHLAPNWIAPESILTIHPESSVIISAYLNRIVHGTKGKVNGLLQWMRTMTSSQPVYREYLEREDCGLLDTRPALEFTTENKNLAVVGAGPGLNDCIPVLRKYRDEVEIIAVSGACPALIHAGLNPDWVVCLEALPVVNEDVAGLLPGTKLIVFSSTNSAVIKYSRFRFFSGENPAGRLRSDGGTSLLPALDFALRRNCRNIFLIGSELSNRAGNYAFNLNRPILSAQGMAHDPPKFTAMRYSIEKLLEEEHKTNSEKTIYHVRSSEIAPLRGTVPLEPDRLSSLLIHDAKHEQYAWI